MTNDQGATHHPLRAALSALAAGCPALQSLALVNIDVSDAAVAEFAVACGPHLRRVALGRCTGGGGWTNERHLHVFAGY
jgi:hypothetical protein